MRQTVSLSPITGALFAVTLWLTFARARADVFTNVPEARNEDFEILYALPIPASAGFRGSIPVPYEIDNRTSVGEFDRVAYYLELTDLDGTRWVYVSMDAFTADPGELGVPHNRDNRVIHQRNVSNLNIASNVPGIVTGTFLDGGNIELWAGDYRGRDDAGRFAADDDLYDWGDGPGGSFAGYGSFQIHNALARQTLLAWNRWGVDDGFPDDIGIGNRLTDHPDWTFAGNAGGFIKRELVILVRPRKHRISFSQLPRNRQLFTRDVETNRASVPIAGDESFGGFDRIGLRVYRDGRLREEHFRDLKYRNGSAPFSFEPSIPAELARYDFELLLDRNGVLTTVEFVRDVVAGDAFLFYGQSNAEAIRYDPIQSANGYASPWLRTFGQNSDRGADTENILYWVPAEGDGGTEDPGAIGQWAMVVGRKVIDTFQVPVAILNGSRGGYSIKKLQKDRLHPNHLDDDATVTRTYNRLLHRAVEAKIAQTARAIFYYQGEAESDNEQTHADGFATLYADWKTDYPALEHIYVVQVRPGCGVATDHARLRDTQRRFADIFPNTSVMATNGLPGHDGCHYAFTGGYEELGWHHFRQVARDLYGAPNDPNIDPLNPLFAEFTDSTRTTIRLVLRNHGSTIHFPAGALADFVLNGSSAAITGRTVQDNAILFHLASPAPEESFLEYRSHLGPGQWVTSAYGIGMLTFIEPVQPRHFLGLLPNSDTSPWLGTMRTNHFNRQDGIGWLVHKEHGWLYTREQPKLSGVWLWDEIQQDWLWTEAAAWPFFYRHNGGDGFWLYYRHGGTPKAREFFDYRVHQWTTVP